LKIFRSRVLPEPPSGDPGTARVSSDTLHVAARDSMVALEELQQEGKRRMKVSEFLRGYRISSGEKFI
jgi:methionyl-tRNA formyltransferase